MISKAVRACAKTRASCGYRSGVELDVAQSIKNAGIEFEYERHRLKYKREHNYTPDFYLPNQGFFIEVKGMFSPSDRQKMLLIKEAYPALDIRLLFQNPNVKLNKKSKTTYGMWADKHDFVWAQSKVPESWLNHKASEAQRSAYKSILCVK